MAVVQLDKGKGRGEKEFLEAQMKTHDTTIRKECDWSLKEKLMGKKDTKRTGRNNKKIKLEGKERLKEEKERKARISNGRHVCYPDRLDLVLFISRLITSR